MARIRTIKPEFFVHEELFDLELETGLPVRLAFAGLWTQADREGRFKWRPRTLKASILPFDDVDFARVLDALATRGFVKHYTVGTREYGEIANWSKHQAVNGKERPSEIPPPSEATGRCDESREYIDTSNALSTRAPRVEHAYPEMEGNSLDGKGKGTGKEGEGKGNTHTVNADSHKRGVCDEEEPKPRGLDPHLMATQLMNIWNPIAKRFNLQRVGKLTDERVERVAQRCRDPDFPRLFREACERKLPVPNTPDFTWQPSFGWLIENGTNVVELLEGKYDRRKPTAPTRRITVDDCV